MKIYDVSLIVRIEEVGEMKDDQIEQPKEPFDDSPSKDVSKVLDTYINKIQGAFPGMMPAMGPFGPRSGRDSVSMQTGGQIIAGGIGELDAVMRKFRDTLESVTSVPAQ